jgi:Kef-type K+ transport system membrane component KefB
MTHSPLLLQIVIVIGTARAVAALLRFFGQSAVIGEMIAGFVLGPAVFGAIAPQLHAEVFRAATLTPLRGLSDLGLVVFMFVVGAELRLTGDMRRQLVAASWIGVLSVLLPMAMGLAVASLLYAPLAPHGVSFLSFSLFLAAALSITAFPVLARILKERDLVGTTVGRLALASAAIADVLCWLLLALVVIVVEAQHNWTRLGSMLLGLTLLAAMAFILCRPLIRAMVRRHAAGGLADGTLLAALLIGAFAFAYITDALGVHVVFGAFLFGICLPRDDRLLATLIDRVEQVTIIVLMPIFFALAGLKTTQDAFIGSSVWLLLWVIVVAVVSKWAAGTFAARISGQPWRAAAAIGSLMNARGMMELIVIQIGLDMGVISRQAFTMLMLMAIVTTVMTGPLLTLFEEGKAPALRAGLLSRRVAAARGGDHKLQ